MSQIEMNTIMKKIAETQAEIQNAAIITDSTLRAVMTSQLETRLAALQKEQAEMEACAAKDTVTLRMYGENVQKGKISTRVLLATLNGFQSMLDSIANAMLHSPTARGRIPDHVRDLTAMEVVGTFAGSFGIVLERQSELVGMTHDDSALDGILSKLFSVLETVDDSEQLMAIIAPYGKRAVTHYRDWLNDMNSYGINLEIGWKNDAASTRQMHLVKEKAPSIISTLDTIDKIDNEEIVLQGVLNGVNIRNHSFEMSVPGLGLVKGLALPETLMGILDKIGTEISANMVKSISSTKAGVEKTSWYLSSIN